MPLQPDQRIAHYRVVEKIGEGGMGEVYRAEDTKLGRSVALKVLPGEFVQDETRLARFSREAQILASLNHPNIATIHGLEEADGITALALELVEGETLAERIGRGPMSLKDAAPIALQIAEALEAAHEKGIIHRDLKPANVKFAADGRVKVLDFGLAKAMVEDVSRPDKTQSPTLSVQATQAGVILGTAAYMSPEQAAGNPADRRADIWAFGVVLAEMLTGSRPFQGESVSYVLAAVLKDEPDLDSLPAGVPARIIRLLRRCLQKDPKQRLQAIGEARIALDDIISGKEPERSALSGAPTDHASARGTVPRSTWMVAVPWIAVAVLAGALVAGWFFGGAPAASHEPLHLVMPVAPAAGIGTGSVWGGSAEDFAISHDGRTVAFAGRRGEKDGGHQVLMLRRLGVREAALIPNTEGAESPFFSADDSFIGFIVDGGIRRVRTEGGPVETVLEDKAYRAFSATWSEELGIIFSGTYRPGAGSNEAIGATMAGRRSGIWSVMPASGVIRPLMESGAGDTWLLWPELLPGGESVIFTALRPADVNQTTIDLLNIGEGTTRTLVEGSGGQVFRQDHLVYCRSGRLLVSPFDPAAEQVTGPGRAVMEGLVQNKVLRTSKFALSANGTLIYLANDALPVLEDTLLSVDRQGRIQSMGAPPLFYTDIRASPDGRYLAFSLPTGGNDIWVRDLVRNTQTRVTFEDGEDESPVWSPDGRWLVWSGSREDSGRRIFRRRPDGSGQEEIIWEGEPHVHPSAWTPDGKTLILDVSSGKGADIAALDLEGGGEIRPLLAEPYDELHARLSPDGRWLAYTADASGRSEIYLQSYPALDRRLQVSVNGGAQPVWSPNGGEIFFRAGRNRLMVVEFSSTSGEPAISAPQQLFSREFGTGKAATHFSYDVGPDNRFFMTVEDSAFLPDELAVVLNADVLLTGPAGK